MSLKKNKLMSGAIWQPCCCIIQVDYPHWWCLKRFPLLCKAICVPRKALYKCNDSLLLLNIEGWDILH